MQIIFRENFLWFHYFFPNLQKLTPAQYLIRSHSKSWVFIRADILRSSFLSRMILNIRYSIFEIKISRIWIRIALLLLDFFADEFWRSSHGNQKKKKKKKTFGVTCSKCAQKIHVKKNLCFCCYSVRLLFKRKRSLFSWVNTVM